MNRLKSLNIIGWIIATLSLSACTASAGDLTQSGPLLASGFIEAEDVSIAAEIGGRVTELPYAEGDSLEAGALLIQLDDTILQAQRDIIEAQLDIAEAQRDLIAAGARPEIIAQGYAQVAVAQAAVDAASATLGAAATLRNNPQDIEIQVIDAATQIYVAQEQVTAAQIQFNLASEMLDNANQAVPNIRDAQEKFEPLGITVPMPLQVAYAPYDYREAEANLNSALEALNGAQAILGTLQELAENPQAYQSQVAQASGSLQTAKAALERANAELARLEAGPRDEDLQVADAQIAQIEAQIEALDIQIDKLAIRAPLSGVVLEQAIHVGELASPGIPLITLADLSTVELRVYLPADQYGSVSLGQEVEVTVDSFPGRIFEGVVVLIADEAEFTPRNVQTREERVNLVYGITIRIENPDEALKPGVPADARFR